MPPTEQPPVTPPPPKKKRFSILGALSALIPIGYLWNALAGRYINATTGRFVPFRVVYGLLSTNEDVNASTLLSLTQSLQDNDLTPVAWLAAFYRQLRILHVQNAALGAGGLARLQASDYSRLDTALREDEARLVSFGQQIANGELSDAQIQVRIGMYIGSARLQYYKSQRQPVLRRDEAMISRRRLGVAEHCLYCLHLVDLGWQPYGVLPWPGESSAAWEDDQCLVNCRCSITHKVIKSADVAQYVKRAFTLAKAG